MSIRLGFTGSRDFNGWEQTQAFINNLKEKSPYEFHDGDCLNWDVTAHELVKKFFPLCEFVGHPPDNDKHRAHQEYNMSYEPRPYLERNENIVDLVDEMLACPATMKDMKHSGTWYTIRYSRKVGRKLTIIYPDGTTGE